MASKVNQRKAHDPQYLKLLGPFLIPLFHWSKNVCQPAKIWFVVQRERVHSPFTLGLSDSAVDLGFSHLTLPRFYSAFNINVGEHANF